MLARLNACVENLEFPMNAKDVSDQQVGCSRKSCVLQAIAVPGRLPLAVHCIYKLKEDVYTSTMTMEKAIGEH